MYCSSFETRKENNIKKRGIARTIWFHNGDERSRVSSFLLNKKVISKEEKPLKDIFNGIWNFPHLT